jgi:predicted MFS family arabinose efflux permease
MKSISQLFSNAFGGLPTTVWLLSVAQLINRSGTMVVFFLSVYLKEELGFSLDQIGIIMALFGVGTISGVWVGGRLVDRWGYYPVMIASLGAGAVMFSAVSFIKSFELLASTMFIVSFCAEAFRPANMAAISYYAGPEIYTRAVSLNRLAINLGFSIGPAIGGFLSELSFTYIFWADALTCFLAMLMLLFFVKKSTREIGIIKDETSIENLRSPYRDRAFLWFLPIAMLYAISFFQFFSTMPIYYTEVEGLSKSSIGWIMALNGLLVALFEMLIIYKYEKRWSLYNFIILGTFLVVLSYLSLLFLGGFWWMIAITVVISFSEMFAMPFMNTFMNNRAVGGMRGQYSSLYIMAWSSSQILTPIIATQVIDHSGFQMLWIVMALLALMSTFGAYLLKRYTK